MCNCTTAIAHSYKMHLSRAHRVNKNSSIFLTFRSHRFRAYVARMPPHACLHSFCFARSPRCDGGVCARKYLAHSHVHAIHSALAHITRRVHMRVALRRACAVHNTCAKRRAWCSLLARGCNCVINYAAMHARFREK